MTLELQKGEAVEEIPCPEGVVLIGVNFRIEGEVNAKGKRFRYVMNVIGDVGEKAFCKAFHAKCEKLTKQWDGEELTIFLFRTRRKALRKVIESYAGLPMLEFTYADLSLRAVL